MKPLSSGQMAKQNRVSEKALRVYQEKGILVPAHVDERTGRRFYDIQQSTKLDMILQLQQMGFSLNEIAELNEGQSMEQLHEAAIARLAAIDERQRELALSRRLAEQLVSGCEVFFNQPILNQITVEMLPEQHILKFPVPNPEKLQAGASGNNAEQWEVALRSARQEIYDRGYPLTLFGNMGTLIPEETLRAGHPVKEYIFAYVTEDFGTCYRESEILPGGQHLTLYLYQAYDNGRELDSERLLAMADYAESHGMAVNGNPFGEVLCRYPRFFDMGEHLLYRLCMPVRKADSEDAGNARDDESAQRQ